MRSEREEVGVSQAGELRLQSQQIALGGSIQLPLLWDRVAAVAFGDVTRNRHGGEHDGIGRRFGLASCDLANDAEHLATQRDSFLPHFEISDAGSHSGKMAGAFGAASIYSMRPVTASCAQGAASDAVDRRVRPCGNPRL